MRGRPRKPKATPEEKAGWHFGEIPPPEYHSTAFSHFSLLLSLDRQLAPVTGRFIGGLIQQFVQDGFPTFYGVDEIIAWKPNTYKPCRRKWQR